jgi:hypothetical protein
VARGKHAQDHYTIYFKKLSRWYDLFRGVYAGRFQAFRNNIHIPLLFSVIQSDVARKVQTSFGAWPIVEFHGYAPEDAPIARKNEVLVSAQMKDCRSFEKAVDFFLTADMYGVGIARYGWRKTIRNEQWRVLDDSGMTEAVMKAPVTRFDGPDWDVVDPLDFWPQPGVRRIDDMAWVIHRYYLDLDELKDMAEQGIFDRRAVATLVPAPVDSQLQTTFTERMSVYRSYADFEARRTEPHAQPVELWEYWGMVPSEFAPDNVRMRVITIANRRVVLRNKPNPFWHGEIPYIAYCPQPDPHYFPGIGKCEIGEKMQITANRLANQKLDGIDLTIDPVFLMNRQAGIDTQNLYMRAGKVIGVDGAVDDSVIRPLIPNTQGIQQAYQEIAQLWQWIQSSTGISEDVVSGMPSNNRQTAREYLGRQEAVLTRLMLEARLAEEGFVEPLANKFRQLNRQYLKVPHEVKILGSVATVNPITGYPLPQEPQIVDLADLNPDYRARAMGATQMLGKNVRQQNLIAVLQAASANPVATQMVNWANFFRLIFRAFDLDNTDELLNQQPTMAGMGAGGAPGAPPGPAPPGADNLTPINPGMYFGGQSQAPMAPMGGLMGNGSRG